eukprot:gene8543-8726_t
MICLTTTSWLPGLTPGPTEDATWLQCAALTGALGVIALGTGGIKPNVSAFGADQFDEKDPQDKREKESFFNWFYLAINVGSLIACTVVVYVQDQISWTVGFALPAAAMAMAVLLFLAGSSHYRHVAPTESPMARVVKVVAAALSNRWRSRRGSGPAGDVSPKAYDPAAQDADGSLHRVLYYQRAQMYGLTGDSGTSSSSGHGGSGQSSFSSGLPPKGPPGSARLTRPTGSLAIKRSGPTASSSYRWLEDAITEWQTSQGQLVVAGAGASGVTLGGYTPQQVDEVKLVLRLLPVFFTTVMYWTIYSMMGTFFIQEGTLMDNAVTLPGSDWVFNIPAATMALFNTGAIIILVPLYDTFFEPGLRRLGVKWTLLRRIGWGMLLAVLAMLYSAGVESWRLGIFNDMQPAADAPGGGGSGGGPKLTSYGPAVVPLSILWQAPSYMLVGASEVLASIAQLEFFYDQAPDVMRSCSMALQLLSTAVGSYLGGGLVAAVAAATSAAGTPWLPKDLNYGHLDYFLLLCAGLMLVNTLLFVAVANKYEYKAVEHMLLVQVPDVEDQEQPQLQQHPALGLPVLPPSSPPAGTAISINATATRRSQYHYAAAAADEDGGLYSRSLAFVPTSPALPAPFR